MANLNLRKQKITKNIHPYFHIVICVAIIVILSVSNSKCNPRRRHSTSPSQRRPQHRHRHDDGDRPGLRLRSPDQASAVGDLATSFFQCSWPPYTTTCSKHVMSSYRFCRFCMVGGLLKLSLFNYSSKKRGGLCNNISSSVLHLETLLFLQKENIPIIKEKVSNHNISKNLKHYEILNVLRTFASLCAKPVCTDISQCKNHQPSFRAAAIAFGNNCIYCVALWGSSSSLLSLSR